MFASLLLCAVASVAGFAVAGSETLLSCAEGSKPAINGFVPGAVTMCHQTVAGAGTGTDTAMLGTNGEPVAAFLNHVLVGVRQGYVANPADARTDTFQPGEWRETGSIGIPGELWWCRTANRYVFLGQESRLRLTNTSAVPPSQLPAMQDFLMRRIVEACSRS